MNTASTRVEPEEGSEDMRVTIIIMALKVKNQSVLCEETLCLNKVREDLRYKDQSINYLEIIIAYENESRSLVFQCLTFLFDNIKKTVYTPIR